MNDEIEKDDAKGNWVSEALEGGLPQIVAGPAGKAISRLIGAGADIPAAWIEGVAQGIRDRTSARTQVTNAIAAKAAEMAVDNPKVMDRALHGMLAKSYRTQTNREAVAKVAVKELKLLPPTSDIAEGPTDDWMNKFERFAEDAPNEDVRLMFGRLLAEEIRSPGKISSATLRFVSELDSEVAQLIQKVLPYCTVEGSAYLSAIEPELSFEDCTRIAQSGFWTFDGNLMQTLKPSPNGIGRIELRSGLWIAVKIKPGKKMSIKSAMLSKIGVDFVGITDTKFDFTKLKATIEALPDVDSAFKEQT